MRSWHWAVGRVEGLPVVQDVALVPQRAFTRFLTYQDVLAATIHHPSGLVWRLVAGPVNLYGIPCRKSGK
ncbi:hypothetical protein RSOLAG22IIIB_12888 [Rhizoctonia solani]|uniref:Uncharacterized protein n=1 Tax=Rhizoctonia solani TaxID=456999 RepID=A0A0K6GHN0_9AGAM|nr:hypothetical protein RSOLAG22IIIB_12888 [Rhizoctonia solani]